MIDPLRRVLIRRPDEAFGGADPARWHYASRPDLQEARREHDALVDLLRGAGAEVIDHAEPQPDRADSIFVFDPVLITDRGTVLLRMGKALRRGEEEALGRRLQDLSVPLLGALQGEATAEGGTSSGSTATPSPPARASAPTPKGSANSARSSPLSTSRSCRSNCPTSAVPRPASISCR